MKRNRYAFALLASASGVAMATAAMAAGAETAQAPPAVEEIVVTGSRVVTNGTASPTPLTVVSMDELQASAPSSIADALEKLPQFSGSLGPLNTNTPSNIGTSGPTQGNFVNLRGLGTNRALILLDGQRVPPTSYDGSVDLDTLPQTLVTRVDVVTGGASAAYGSDAISGVINYVLDKKYEGVKASVQGGLSNFGDDGSQRYQFTAGHAFNDNFHVEGSFEHYESSGIYSDNERPLGVSMGTALVGTGLLGNPYQPATGIQQVNNSFQGEIRSGAFINYIFNNNGTISKINPGIQNTATGTTYGYGATDGETYNGGVNKTLIAPQTTNQAFGRVDFEANPDLTLYAQGVYGGSKSHFKTMPTENNAPGAAQLAIYPNNAYLTPGEVTQIFGANPSPTASFLLGRFDQDLPPYVATLKTSAWNGSIGANGKLGDWSYNINYNHSRSTLLATETDPLVTNLGAAVDAVVNPANGQIVCAVSLTQYANLYPGCAPINLFGTDPTRNGAPNQASINFIYNPLFYYDVVNKMDIVDVSANGELFSIPAGPVKIAIGGEYRHQSLIEVTDGSPSQINQDLGLRAVNPTSNPTVYAQDAAANTNGSVNVKEGFGEISVPLIRNEPFFQAADLDLAGRVTDYSTSGTVETWKLGLTDAVDDQLRLRGTASRDIRAPSLYQLYQKPSQSIGGFTDPLTNVQQSLLTQNGGNPSLVPETAITLTGGFVYQPAFAEGLSVSIDYYKINMKNAIGSESTMQEVLDCDASGGTAAICSAIKRPISATNNTAGNFPTSIAVELQNFAHLDESGIDLEASYKVPATIFGGNLTARLFANFLFNYLSQLTPTAAVLNYAGYLNGNASLPKVKGNLSLTYTNGPLDVTVSNRMTGSVKQSPNLFYVSGFSRLPNYDYTDLNVTYEIVKDEYSLQPFLSISNLFNTQPPFVPAGTNPDSGFPTIRSMYDVVGRYYTAGVRFKY